MKYFLEAWIFLKEEGKKVLDDEYNINFQALPETLNKKLPENVADVEVSLS